MHYVLDLWFKKIVKKHCQGETYLVRYANDFIAMFQNEEDARKFYNVLPKRLGKFGLAIAEEKTRILEFGRFAIENRKHLISSDLHFTAVEAIKQGDFQSE